MKKKNIIKMILMFFGYKDIEINTHWTGTSDGQYPNSLSYEIEATDKDGACLSIRESDFCSAIGQLLMDVTDSDINDPNRLVHCVYEEDFSKINN